MSTSAVEKFILQHIHSVEQLEILLLLRRDRRAWTAAEVKAELRTADDAATMRLCALLASNIIAPAATTNAFVYAPPTPEIDAVIGELEQAYRERRVAVISLIYSKPHADLKAFSDAFRMRPPDRRDPNKPEEKK
jgi:hypothetical protein